MTHYPSFYAIIPANVRYDKELSANSKLLYGEITALTQREGFCWSTNKYFSELYDVEERTISRWIGELVSRGYIDICIEKTTTKWSRKIYLKNVLTTTKMSGGGRQKCPPAEDKNVHTLQQIITTKEQQLPAGEEISPKNTQEEKPVSASPSVVSSSHEEEKIDASLTPVDIPKSLKIKLTKQYSSEQLRQAIACVSSMKPDNVAASLIAALKNGWTPVEESSEDVNRALCARLMQFDGLQVKFGVLEVSPSYVRLRGTAIDGSKDVDIFTKDRGFKLSVKGLFEKYGFSEALAALNSQ